MTLRIHRNNLLREIMRSCSWLAIPLLLAQAASAQQVAKIRITNALNTWLQVSEVVALDSGGADVALLTNPSLSVSSSGIGFNGPEFLAINGIAPGFCENNDCTVVDGQGIYHSSSPSSAFYELSFSVPVTVVELSIFGRTDNNQSERDVYDVELLGDAGEVILFATNVSANNDSYRGDVDLAGLLPVSDVDNDGIADTADNCTLIANSDQRDSDGDGFGNDCDPDLDNNGIVNFLDVTAWIPVFNSACGDVASDFNGDGACNFADFILLSEFFLQVPGPSAPADQ